jgi:hypothetical protein
MADEPETQFDESRPMPPWMRGLIAIAVMLGLGGFSQIVAGQPLAQLGAGATPTATFGARILAITPVATRRPTPSPTRVRIPTRMPDTGTNKNQDMCTVIPSEHAARPSVPMCVIEQTPQPE